jgi:hypothetical protein
MLENELQLMLWFIVETKKGVKEHTRIVQILSVTLNTLSQIAEGGWKLLRKWWG